MIRLGYEIGNGRPVDIPDDRHIGVTGQTQMSGKTTTLEALVHRSKRRAVAFVTKRAENSFREAHAVAPYFRDSGDWEFVAAILEAMLGEKMKFERSWIIDACRAAESLADVHAEVKMRLHGVANEAYAAYYKLAKKERKGKAKPKNEWSRKPASGINASVFTSLEAYLDKVIPQIERLPYVKTLELTAGLNVMDLSEYTTEMQGLVIRSVLEWVYERERNTIVIIPEAWEFIPQNRRSPVLLAAEELIRKGAASGNYVWLDSQDIAGVHKNVLRSVGVWILGVQREANEINRTIAHAGAPATKLKPEAIMQLTRGQFFACWDSNAIKTYVQPFWVGETHARAIARSEETLSSAEEIWRERRRTAAQEKSHNEKTADDQPETTAVLVRVADQEEKEETMWKEKYEALEREVISLRETNKRLFAETERLLADRIAQVETSPNLPDPAAASPKPPFPKRDNGAPAERVAIDGFTDAGYELLKRRLLADPGVLAVLNCALPELRVKIERPVLQIDGDTSLGRLALLIHDGFFSSATPSANVLREFKARGWIREKAGYAELIGPMKQVTEMGFLRVEAGSYTAVPGMKIEKAEA